MKQPSGNREVMIFANPIAGRGLGKQIAHRLHRSLQTHGYQVRAFIERAEDIRDSELKRGARAAIVIGGDGTLRGVVERLVAADCVPPMLPVPLGTANLMGRHLGIHWNRSNVEAQVMGAIERHQTISIDAAKANERLFLLMTGVGFDAFIVHELDRLRKGPIGYWNYLLPSAQALKDYRFAPLRVMLDGKQVFDEAPALAFVGNLSEYGTGFPVLPFAKADDGLLDLCVMPCRTPEDLARLFLLAAAGEHTKAEGVVYRKGTSIRIESPRSVPVQIDGDPAGHTPVQIDLLPVRVPFIVP
jgi:diacylglycerol kinase (ATP)